MNLILFKLQLISHLSFFLLELSANLSKKTKPLVLSSFVFLLLIGSFVLINTVKNATPKQAKISPAPTPKNPSLYSSSEYSIDQLNKQLSFWKRIEETQPNSKDVLINISKLNQALGNTEEHDLYWKKASKLSPNSALFN